MVDTPAIDSLASGGVVFENHFTASAPCMPARRELLTGILELRHRCWGPLEPFDRSIPKLLKNIDCPSMLITDHYHYFEVGGENYHTDFTGYESIRGLESDNWKTYDVKKRKMNPLSTNRENFDRSRVTYKDKTDYPIVKTFEKAIEWVDENKDTQDFFLYIDEFDPHEPFIVPDEYLKEYDDSGYVGLLFEWPDYGKWKGNDVELAHVRNRYCAKIKFLDDMVDLFLKKLKENELYDDTTIILTTDHGHYLGEHGLVGKPSSNNYNTLYNIPLIIKPALSLNIETERRIAALTSTPDIFATICDINGIEPQENIYGKSILPLLKGKKDRIRDYVLYGYYGGQLGYCDGKYTYLKSPESKDNSPLYYYSTRLTTFRGKNQDFEAQYQRSSDISIGKYIPGIDYPVQKFKLETPPTPVDIKTFSPDALYDLESDRSQ